MSATLAILQAPKSVLVFMQDDALRADIVKLLCADGYDATGTRDEAELRAVMHAPSACVLVVDVGSVTEETLQDLSCEGRVPRIVVFSSRRGEAPLRPPFHPEVLRAAVSRAWRADDEPSLAMTQRRRTPSA